MFLHGARLGIIIIIVANIFTIIDTQQFSLCESLNEIENITNGAEVTSRRIRALCDVLYSSRDVSELDELDAIPDFDFNQIDSDKDANQILKRFRRGRFSSGGSRSSSSGSRFSSSFSRSGSSGSGLFSRSSSSSGSGSRIFSRSGSSSSSSSGSGGSRFFSRSSPSSSSSSGHRVRDAFRSIGGKPTSSGTGIGGSSVSSGRQHRVREAVRTMFRSSSRSKPSGLPSASGGIAGGGAVKPSIGDKFRQITHGSGGVSRFGSGASGSGFGGGGISGSGGNAWVRAGKKFLPVAVRFGKRYYQRRKYQKGIYAGAGFGAGYYAGNRMGGHHGGYYGDRYSNNYGYPPTNDVPPNEVDGKPPTVFYCIQEDLNSTLVNTTLNNEGMGVCNVSGSLIACPVEIECKMSEADNCCEDEQGIPYCCGGPIPTEYASQYGGYGDDWDDAADSFNTILNMITAMSLVLATICFTVWRHQER